MSSTISIVRRRARPAERLKQLSLANDRLRREVADRLKVERALKESQSHYVSLFEQSLRMQEQLRHLSRQLLLAQEEERKRISRELHDEIVQALVSITVNLSSLKAKAQINTKDLIAQICETQRMVETSVATVHRFARELRPTVLDDLGLAPALRTMSSEFTERTSIPVRLMVGSGVDQLDKEKQTVLYRVAQSALSNVHRHAHANKATLSLGKYRGGIRLEIRDNGKSFDIEKVLFAKRHKQLGLLGSRERVEMVGGQFYIESKIGKGTSIRAEVPLNRSAIQKKVKAALVSVRMLE